jgi:hypothetical protein
MSGNDRMDVVEQAASWLNDFGQALAPCSVRTVTGATCWP